MLGPSGNGADRKANWPSAAWLVCAAALSLAAVAVVLLWAFQSRFIFEPDRVVRALPADLPFPVVDVMAPVGKSRGSIHGWWMPSDKLGARVILYFHGNDGNISTRLGEITPLRELDYSIFLFDYRGFGGSEGEYPSEQSVYEDAEAAWSYLVQTRGVDPGLVYMFGHSLGGAIAIELALHHPEAAGLIVESSFTSIEDMARITKPFALLPVSYLLTQRFDSMRKVKHLRVPVLYVHGSADRTIPFAMAERLFSASASRKAFVAIEGGDHDDIPVVGGLKFRSAIHSFIEEFAAAGTRARPRRDDSATRAQTPEM